MKTKKKTNSYIVFYSESCTPHAATFSSRRRAFEFVWKFIEDNLDNQDDNWVDCVVKGTIQARLSGWDGYVEVDKRKSKKS